jgi:hypothetical protein
MKIIEPFLVFGAFSSKKNLIYFSFFLSIPEFGMQKERKK